MDETSQPTKEINGQHLLPEIVCKIFKKLNVQDLSKVASVSRLWNQEAKREQMKRGLEKVVIPVTNDRVCDSIAVRPYVTLMFVAPKVIQYGVKTLQFDVLQKYKDAFPDYLVTVGLHYVIMDKELMNCNHEMSEGGILSLLIPKYRDLKIRAAYTQHLFRNEKHSAVFLNEFLPEDLSSNATIIIFGQSAFNNSQFFNSLKKSMEERQQKFSLWGASFDNAPFAAVSGKIDESVIEESEQFADHIGYNGMFAMSITGMSLESSSIVIDCKIKKQEFEKKLSDFRDQLQLKHVSIGLVCGPEEVYDWSDADLSDVYTSFPEMMDVVKRIFPKIPCIGIYDKSCLDRYYGLKSRNDDPDQQLEHEMSLTLMILTYD